MKRKKAAMRQTAQEDGRMGRYQVAKKDNLKYSDPIISIGAGYIF